MMTRIIFGRGRSGANLRSGFAVGYAVRYMGPDNISVCGKIADLVPTIFWYNRGEGVLLSSQVLWPLELSRSKACWK